MQTPLKNEAENLKYHQELKGVITNQKKAKQTVYRHVLKDQC